MRKNELISFVNYIVIGGEKVLMDTLSEKEREEIAVRLNDKAMKAIGYIRSDKTA
ncbi:hypothetical protein [Anaerosacchariphilus polymeriproducens]|uniref:hypothetical protein n=1 Tax=Anaerosacchariphilus polymeriproducens TaxID=1812858 RepID=UPI0012D73063|nr:hypothetical protein [Anaerosacchariphilus polymeriproducens]